MSSAEHVEFLQLVRLVFEGRSAEVAEVVGSVDAQTRASYTVAAVGVLSGMIANGSQDQAEAIGFIDSHIRHAQGLCHE